ncbi:MAG: hypothetical protein KDD58_12565 [Bdellovibrionales bacterium]|nr:hypothetical protein [Bdellovibrionales bacterium]
MYLPNCKINLSGLFVSNDNKQVIESIMQLLVNKSPSNSFLSLCIVSGESEVHGFLSISSKAMNFESSQYGNDLISVVKILSSDVQEQLKKWIAQRVF